MKKIFNPYNLKDFMKMITMGTLLVSLIPLFSSTYVEKKEDLGETKTRNSLDSLGTQARELVLDSLSWTDHYWDERAGLIWSAETKIRIPSEKQELSRHQKDKINRLRSHRTHDVRQTSFYALGLLLRNQQGDNERAFKALNAVLDEQIDQPGMLYHGTFYRNPEETPPPTNPQDLVWTHYDPNWRQFIGTTFAIILEEYEKRLPQQLQKKMENSIQKAVEGEQNEFRTQHRGRSGGPMDKGLEHYTNIALMHAFLWTYAGDRLKKPEWIKEGEEFATTIYNNFKRYGTFEEYNCPSYYGVDLFGLALWRAYGPTPLLQRMGSELEAELWKDIALHYHAGLKNLAGPYSRASGMDMQKYVSLTGLWLYSVLGPKLAPLPQDGNFDYAPHFAILGAKIPQEAMKHFKSFLGERLVKRVITPKRVAYSWIGKDFMLGAETTHRTRLVATRGETVATQFYPVTVHWKTPQGNTSWIKLIDSPRLDARAEKNMLYIYCIGDAIFRIAAPDIDPKSVQYDLWKLPGLSVQVKTDALDSIISPGDGYIDIHYIAATHFTLQMTSLIHD